jgi:hypothetical protein
MTRHTFLPLLSALSMVAFMPLSSWAHGDASSMNRDLTPSRSIFPPSSYWDKNPNYGRINPNLFNRDMSGSSNANLRRTTGNNVGNIPTTNTGGN